MTDDEAKFRQRINFFILNAIAGNLLSTLKPKEPLLLGSGFELRSNRVFDELELRRKSVIRELNELSVHDLQDNFSDQGDPLTDHWKTWVAAHHSEIRAKYRDLTYWLLVPFRAETALADYDYWSKAAYLALDEALWLSVGLQPLDEFRTRLVTRAGDKKSTDPVDMYMVGRRELFKRELNPNGYSDRHGHDKILEWINRVDLGVHPGFVRMLGLIAARPRKDQVGDPEPSNSQGDGEGRFEAREKTSLAKLLVAMAITEYGYDPDSRRGPIPKEMQDIAARLGLEVSLDTIRLYLQMGARHLPKGWKPNS